MSRCRWDWTFFYLGKGGLYGGLLEVALDRSHFLWAWRENAKYRFSDPAGVQIAASAVKDDTVSYAALLDWMLEHSGDFRWLGGEEPNPYQIAEFERKVAAVIEVLTKSGGRAKR